MVEQRTITINDENTKYIVTEKGEDGSLKKYIKDDHLTRLTPYFYDVQYDKTTKFFKVIDNIYLDKGVSTNISFYLDTDAMPVGFAMIDLFDACETIYFNDNTHFKSGYEKYRTNLKEKIYNQYYNKKIFQESHSLQMAKYQVNMKGRLLMEAAFTNYDFVLNKVTNTKFMKRFNITNIANQKYFILTTANASGKIIECLAYHDRVKGGEITATPYFASITYDNNNQCYLVKDSFLVEEGCEAVIEFNLNENGLPISDCYTELTGKTYPFNFENNEDFIKNYYNVFDQIKKAIIKDYNDTNKLTFKPNNNINN